MSIGFRAAFAGLAALLLSFAPLQAQTIKDGIRGLVSMGAYHFVCCGGDPDNSLRHLFQKPGIFGGVVIVATWNELEPDGNAKLAHGNAIDIALDRVRRYNRQYPQKPLAVRLRIWGGFEAPEWAKNIGGSPISTVHNGKNRTVGRFWLPQYRKAWAALQKKLAARYDGDPLIHEVSVTACMSYTAEPFFVPMDDTVLPELQAAGFTAKAYKECLLHAVEHYAPWQTSRLVLSVNPLRTVPVSQGGKGDPTFTALVMRNCREALGVQCVFDNHDLDATVSDSLRPIYRYMRTLGPEIVFQTANATPTDFDGTIRTGVRYGASAIELYSDLRHKGFPLVPDAQLIKWSNWLAVNPSNPPP